MNKTILPLSCKFVYFYSKFTSHCRYNVRGVNENGDVANFVETEQIVFYHHNICSLVQTRGSIPLIWNQFANIKFVQFVYIFLISYFNYFSIKYHTSLCLSTLNSFRRTLESSCILVMMLSHLSSLF